MPLLSTWRQVARLVRLHLRDPIALSSLTACRHALTSSSTAAIRSTPVRDASAARARAHGTSAAFRVCLRKARSRSATMETARPSRARAPRRRGGCTSSAGRCAPFSSTTTTRGGVLADGARRRVSVERGEVATRSQSAVQSAVVAGQVSVSQHLDAVQCAQSRGSRSPWRCRPSASEASSQPASQLLARQSQPTNSRVSVCWRQWKAAFRRRRRRGEAGERRRAAAAAELPQKDLVPPRARSSGIAAWPPSPKARRDLRRSPRIATGGARDVGASRPRARLHLESAVRAPQQPRQCLNVRRAPRAAAARVSRARPRGSTRGACRPRSPAARRRRAARRGRRARAARRARSRARRARRTAGRAARAASCRGSARA